MILLNSRIGVTREQHDILDHLFAHPVTVVSAGAGAGKTYTTVAAVTELVAAGMAHADQFVLITFTNQAASEMRARLQGEWVEQARDSTRREFWAEQRERLSAAFIGTIHSFCKQILDLHGYEGGVAREASVNLSRRLMDASVRDVALQLLQSADQDPVAALVHQGDWPEYKLRARLERMLSEARNQGISTARLLAATHTQPDDAGKALRVRFAELLYDIETRYEAACEKAQQLDPAALLLKTSELLQQEHGAAIVERIARRFGYLFIDEFQDTSATQAEIATVLAQQLKIVVVGDRKQAIYAFTGANQTLLMKFASRHGTRPLPLRLSGRPSKPLLDVQNALFRSMKASFPDLDDPLQASERNTSPADELPPCVTLLSAADDDLMAAHAALRIRRLIGTPIQRDGETDSMGSIEAGDIAVLVRTNAEVDEWVEALNAQGVPGRSDNGTPVLRRPEIVATYRILQVLVRYPDDVTLVEALNTPHLREVDLSAEIAHLLSYGRERGTPLTGAFERKYPALAEQLRQFRIASLTSTVPQLLGQIDEGFGLKKWYRESGDEDAALALNRLRDYARNRFNSDQALTLRTFVDILGRDIASGAELSEPTNHETRRPPYVRVMTIHRAKGLEFPVVVIPNLHADRSRRRPPDFMLDPGHGLEVNLYPLDVPAASEQFFGRSGEAQKAALGEEMRLLYVAITRAQRMLVLIGQHEAPASAQADAKPVRSWQVEVLLAREAMREHGAKFSALVKA